MFRFIFLTFRRESIESESTTLSVLLQEALFGEAFHHSRLCRRSVAAALVKRLDLRRLVPPAVLFALLGLGSTAPKGWPADSSDNNAEGSTVDSRCRYSCDMRKPFRSSTCALLGASTSESSESLELLPSDSCEDCCCCCCCDLEPP